MTRTEKCSPSEYRYLMVQAIRGDLDALGIILMAFRGPVENTVGKFLRKFRMETYTEDLIQDTFVQAIAGFPRYNPSGGNCSPWLNRIAKNVCIKWARKNGLLLNEEPITTVIEDPEEPVFLPDAITAAVWTADTTAEPVRPPRMDAKSDPARRRQTARRYVGQGVGGGYRRSVPPHVQRSREMYAQM